MIVLLVERHVEETARSVVTASTPLERTPRQTLLAAKLATSSS
jgi:hypothetical protein